MNHQHDQPEGHCNYIINDYASKPFAKTKLQVDAQTD